MLDDDNGRLLSSPAMTRLRHFVLVSFAVILAVGCSSVPPPIQEMADARLAIAAAADADAQNYAPDQLIEAQLLLKSAEDNLERRAYSAARRDANLAKAVATEAREQSEARAGGEPDSD